MSNAQKHASIVSRLRDCETDAEIARCAVDDAIAFMRANPADEGPIDFRGIAELAVNLHAAEAVLARARRIADGAGLVEDDGSVVSIAIAEAEALTSEVAWQAASKLFELSGRRSALDRLDRHRRLPWRRTAFAIGDWVVNSKPPALRSEIVR